MAVLQQVVLGARKLTNARWFVPAVLILAAVLPLAVSSQYWLRVAVVAGIYCIYALGLNLIAGYTGQLSLGHSAFAGIGAYTSALLALRMGLPFWVTIPAAAAMAGLFGLFLGIPVLRLRGDYLAIVTIAFGELVRLVFLNWNALTRGPMGLPNIPKPVIFGYVLKTNLSFYYLVLLLVVVSVLLLTRLVNSRVGRALIAIRENEIAAQQMGISITELKVKAFVIGSLMAGVAGAVFAHFQAYISPDNFTYMESITMICMVVLGGIGSIPGAIVGAITLTVVPELLRSFAGMRMVLFGLSMVLLMLFRPQGLLGRKRH